MTIKRITSFAGWSVLIFIVFATLAPIELRPEITYANLERSGAFALLGLLLGLAYPGHAIRIAVLVFAAALILELLQLLTPDRHGQVGDMIVKTVGGFAGIAVAVILSRLIPAAAATVPSSLERNPRRQVTRSDT